MFKYLLLCTALLLTAPVDSIFRSCVKCLGFSRSRVFLQGFDSIKSTDDRLTLYQTIEEEIPTSLNIFDGILLPRVSEYITPINPAKWYTIPYSDALRVLVRKLHSHKIDVFADIDLNERTEDENIKYLSFLKASYRLNGFRYAGAERFDSDLISRYHKQSKTKFAFGEMNGSVNDIRNWVYNTSNEISAMDFPLRNALDRALTTMDLRHLACESGYPAGYITFNPSKAITFVDTCQTFQSSPFANNNIAMIALAHVYILTHPGSPMILWEHWHNTELARLLKQLIRLRRFVRLSEEAFVSIAALNSDLYAAYIGSNASRDACTGQLAVRMGSQYWEPCGTHWELILRGKFFAVWRAREDATAALLALA